jgi:hypothetical protein
MNKRIRIIVLLRLFIKEKIFHNGKTQVANSSSEKKSIRIRIGINISSKSRNRSRSSAINPRLALIIISRKRNQCYGMGSNFTSQSKIKLSILIQRNAYIIEF